MNRRFLLVVALLPALYACAHAPRARLQQALDETRAERALPGLTLAIQRRHGAPLALASGVERPDAPVALAADAVMPAGSIGKQFVAATALALAREGKVDLDARIDRWFEGDEWFGHVQNAHALTLRLLLSHRGGVGDHRTTPAFASLLREAFSRRPFDPDFRIPPERLVDILRDQAPLFPAGSAFAYSETGYLLAGLALERQCGCRYYDELARRLLVPLGLADTRPAVDRRPPRLVNGHIGSKLAEIGFPADTVQDGALRFSPATEWTGGGLYSSATDLVRWSQALYGKRALAGHSLDEMLAFHPVAPQSDDAYGLGVRRVTTPIGIAYGHAGEFPGYVSIVLYFPDKAASIALQTNSVADPRVLQEAAVKLMGMVLP